MDGAEHERVPFVVTGKAIADLDLPPGAAPDFK
jgi:hypothetical protein